MRYETRRLPVVVVILVFVVGALAAGLTPSFATQKSSPPERYEYRILRERGFGKALEPAKKRDPFGVSEPPKELEEFLNKLGREGWEVEDPRLRPAHSGLKGSREAPGYYLYSEAGENAPRFLRLRRRVQ